MTEIIENKTFDEIQIGDVASLTRALHSKDLETWASVTGNPNLLPAAKEEGAALGGFGHAGGGAVWAAALFSEIIGTRLPGPGAKTCSVSFDFASAVPVGSAVTATATVKDKDAAAGTVGLDCRCVDSAGREVLLATATVVAPTEKLRAPLRALPKVQLRREDRYLELIARCEGLEPMSTAVVHPCSEDALVGAIQAAEHKLIKPILVGPEAKIRATAEQAKVDISPFRIIAADHSHHAAVLAVQLVRSGEAANPMKGSLHTDELLRAVLNPEAGLRTERRLSHCFCLAVPTYERAIILNRCRHQHQS